MGSHNAVCQPAPRLQLAVPGEAGSPWLSVPSLLGAAWGASVALVWLLLWCGSLWRSVALPAPEATAPGLLSFGGSSQLSCFWVLLPSPCAPPVGAVVSFHVSVSLELPTSSLCICVDPVCGLSPGGPGCLCCVRPPLSWLLGPASLSVFSSSQICL